MDSLYSPLIPRTQEVPPDNHCTTAVWKQAKGEYLEVQILRRRKNKAVHPMVMDRLSRLPRKLMPRMFKGFTRKQTTTTVVTLGAQVIP